MFVNYNKILLKIFPILLILITSCTGPYSVPKKGEDEKDTRVIFEEGIEKEKNIQDTEQISKLVLEQKEKVENLAKFGPIRKQTKKNIDLNRKKIINTQEPSTPMLANLNADLYD